MCTVSAARAVPVSPVLALSLASMDEMGSVGRIQKTDSGSPSVWYPVDELTPTAGGRLCASSHRSHQQPARTRSARVTCWARSLPILATPRDQVGKIDINEFATYVAVDHDCARGDRQAQQRKNQGAQREAFVEGLIR